MYILVLALLHYAHIDTGCNVCDCQFLASMVSRMALHSGMQAAKFPNAGDKYCKIIPWFKIDLSSEQLKLHAVSLASLYQS